MLSTTCCKLSSKTSYNVSVLDPVNKTRTNVLHDFLFVVFTTGKLKNMPDHGGNRAHDLWATTPKLACLIPIVVRHVFLLVRCVYKLRVTPYKVHNIIHKNHKTTTVFNNHCSRLFRVNSHSSIIVDNHKQACFINSALIPTTL